MFLGYASEHGHALIDRELYLPQSWAEEAGRRRAAGIPEDVEFTTKPRQALAMISRAIAAGVPFAWFTADETYGQAKYLQAWLGALRQDPFRPGPDRHAKSPCPPTLSQSHPVRGQNSAATPGSVQTTYDSGLYRPPLYAS